MIALPAAFSARGQAPASPKILIGEDRTEAFEIYGSLRTITVTTVRSGAGTGKLVFDAFRDETGRVPVIDGGYFDQATPVRVEVDFDGFAEHLVSATVLKMAPDFPENRGEATFTVEIQDESALMDRESVTRTWPADGTGGSITDRAILAGMMERYGGRLAVDDESAEGQTHVSLNQDKTDYAFFVERAEANGYEFRVVDGAVYFGPPRLSGEAQPALFIYAGPDTNAAQFQVEEAGEAPHAARVATTNADGETEDHRIEPDLPLLADEPAARTAPGLPPNELRLDAQGDQPPGNLLAIAQGRINAASLSITAGCVVDGTAYGHILRPGALVTIDGVGERHGGRWYVDMVENELDATGYRQKATLKRNAVNRESPR